MKVLIPILIGLLVVGCGKNREVTPENVIGTYEITNLPGDHDHENPQANRKYTWRLVLLEDGIVEDYKNGEKEENEGKWKIIDGEINVFFGEVVGAMDGKLVVVSNGYTIVFRINKDVSITAIANITKDGKREEVSKREQLTLKKIK